MWAWDSDIPRVSGTGVVECPVKVKRGGVSVIVVVPYLGVTVHGDRLSGEMVKRGGEWSINDLQ